MRAGLRGMCVGGGSVVGTVSMQESGSNCIWYDEAREELARGTTST